jgi:hypothetical protein
MMLRRVSGKNGHGPVLPKPIPDNTKNDQEVEKPSVAPVSELIAPVSEKEEQKPNTQTTEPKSNCCVL